MTQSYTQHDSPTPAQRVTVSLTVAIASSDVTERHGPPLFQRDDETCERERHVQREWGRGRVGDWLLLPNHELELHSVKVVFLKRCCIELQFVAVCCSVL